MSEGSKANYFKKWHSVNKTHWMSYTRFYRARSSMNGRCNRIMHKDYDKYGGRGIKLLWKSFEEFRDDMYEIYLEHVEDFWEKQTTLDRIDNDGNYCENNCRWATYKEQENNRSDTIIIEYNWKKQSMKQWAEELWTHWSTLRYRFKKGMSVEECFTKSIHKYERKKLPAFC